MMSTKIYTAWRCTPKAFPNFLASFREHCLDKIGKRVQYLAGGLKTERLREIYDTKDWAKELSFEEFNKKHGKRISISQVFKLAAMASESAERDPMFCIDCSINFWLQGRYVYIIPYGEQWVHQSFNLPENVEDYCYWNNTDEPEGMTWRQWQARGKNWDKICDDWDSARNVHEVVNAATGVGLVAISKQFLNVDQAYSVLPYKEPDFEARDKKRELKSKLIESFTVSYKRAMEVVK